MSKRHLITGILVLAAGATGIAVWFRITAGASERGPRTATPLTVESIAVVVQPSYERTVEFTGRVVAERTAELRFEHAGKVVSVGVDDGSRVNANVVLAELDTRKLRARRARVAAEAAQARAMLRELENGEREEVVRVARADVDELKAQLVQYEADVLRSQRLNLDGTVTKSTLDEVLARRNATQARLAAAIARRDEAERGPRQERIDAQSALVDALVASVAEIDAQIEDSKIVAPFAGTIAARHVDEGTVVGPERTVLRLVESHELEVRVGLPVDVAPRLESGALFQVVVEGRRVATRFSRLLPELDAGTRTRVAVFHVDDSSAVVPGEVARVSVTETVEERGFWVPTAALVAGVRGLWTGFAVVEDESRGGESGWHVEQHDLEVLYLDGGRAYVRGTISNGDRIVANGSHRIVSGQAVRPVTEADELVALTSDSPSEER